MKGAILVIGLFSCACACERQDFTGPLVLDAAPDAADAAAEDAAPDAPDDARDAGVDALPDAPPPLPVSCKDVLARDPSAQTGVFTIDTDGPGARAPFDVECDMTTDGGGWTVIARSTPGGIGAFGWGSAAGDPAATSAPYSLSPAAQGLAFTSVLAGARDITKGAYDWVFVYELPVDGAFVAGHTASSASVAPVAVRGCGAGVPSFLRHAGYTSREGSFFFRDSDDSSATSGLTPSGWAFAGVAPPDGVGCATYGGLYGAQGMLMVR